MTKTDELKAKNENLFERNTILLNENERLKKENADLKRDKEDLIFVRNAKADHIIELKEQLKQAKGIIKELEDCFFFLFERYNEVRGHKKINVAIGQAEQFLKEIEK